MGVVLLAILARVPLLVNARMTAQPTIAACDDYLMAPTLFRPARMSSRQDLPAPEGPAPPHAREDSVKIRAQL